MPKRLIKRYIPDQKTLHSNKSLQIFGNLLLANNLWHLNKKSVSGAFSVGLFCAFVPVPFQMLLAAGIALVFRVNLPLSVALVWITNPITMPPIFYGTYVLGAWLMDVPSSGFEFQLSWEWLSNELSHSWKPFLLGCGVAAISAAIIGNIFARLIWRMLIVRNWNRRKAKRQSREKST